MKTFENLDGIFVSNNPGLENTIFGRDKNNNKVLLNSLLFYVSHNLGFIERVNEHNWAWINHNLSYDAIVISEKEAEKISNEMRIIGNWKQRINRF